MAVIVVVVLRLTGIELTEIGVGLALTDIIGQPDTELAAKNQPGGRHLHFLAAVENWFDCITPASIPGCF